MALAALALLIENLVGYPKWVFATLRHPVQWFGKLIEFLDDRLNNAAHSESKQRNNGILAVIILCVLVAIPSTLIAYALSLLPYGWVLNVFLATVFIAQKSLRDHVAAVDTALGISVESARMEVAKIVGRDPNSLDKNDIAKAALESLAENTSDGVVAPAFWYAVAGLPGIAIYKAINTADSMIGHKSAKHLHFGWASARLDDVVNLPASRFTGFLFTAAALLQSRQSAISAWRTMWRYAGKHASPNAGWPETAMAGALGLKFGGPRSYDGKPLDLPWMGDGKSPEPLDINRGLVLADQAGLLLAAALLTLAIVL